MKARRPVLPDLLRVVAESLVVFLILTLVPIVCWLALRAVDPWGAAIPVPLGLGRELDVNYWTTERGLAVVLWYQDMVKNVRMGGVELPVGWW